MFPNFYTPPPPPPPDPPFSWISNGQCLRVSADKTECERGFSMLNHVKNELLTKITQENLNAAMAVGMDTGSCSSFPWKKLVS